MKSLFHLVLIFIVTLSLWGASSDRLIKNEHDEAKKTEVALLDKKIDAYDQSLKANEWIVAYANANDYRQVKNSLDDVKDKIARLRSMQDESTLDEMSSLLKESETLSKRLASLEEYKKGAFEKLFRLEQLPTAPTVTNPFAMINGLSYLKTLDTMKETSSEKLKHLSRVIDDLEKKRELLLAKQKLLASIKGMRDERIALHKQIDSQVDELTAFHEAKEQFTNIVARYEQTLTKQSTTVRQQIKEQGEDLLFLGTVLLVLLILTIGLRSLLKRVVTDDELLYTANKVLTVVTFLIAVLVILFVYIDDVSYLVTILGFASAGLAIAMKDWFMSILGWFVILVGGMVKVGDRIKLTRHGDEVIGDILDISPIRMTLYEEITLLSYTKHKRAGRVIFIPNHVIFSDVILNYSHAGLKTVWDTIELVVTFDSNHRKATHIVKEIARKYSKGYTDLTRKQFGKMRDRYSLRHTNADARVFTFIEPHGLKISMWYLTNSFATLTLKSTISTEIIDAFAHEDDIRLAYPTQTLYLDSTGSSKKGETWTPPQPLP